MKYRELGKTNIKVSTVCLGTATWGEQNTQVEASEQLDYAIDKGINFIDTGEMYPIASKAETYGASEKIIGNWFWKKKNRHKIILASKIASKANGLEWIRGGAKNLGFDKKNMDAAVNSSLKRLKTDYIDVYQLHWPERKVPAFGALDFEYDPDDNEWTSIEEVLENLNSLVKEGKVRNVGLSNETPWGVMKFLRVADDYNLPKMVSIQNAYNLVNRVFDIATSEVSMRENIGLLAYSPLAGGRLSGKYISEEDVENSRYTLWPKQFSRHHTARGDEAIKSYVELAKQYDISAATFANSFVLSRPFVTSTIIGATSMKQLAENIDCVNITLSEEILQEIQKIHNFDPNPCV